MDDVVRARVSGKIKRKATAVLLGLGTTPSAVVRMFLTKIAREQQIPMEALLPNQTTIDAMKAADAGQVRRFKNARQMLTVLNAEAAEEETRAARRVSKRGRSAASSDARRAARR